MKILFGNIPDQLKNKYICIELDLIQRDGMDQPIAAWAAIEQIPISEMPIVQSLIDTHITMMSQYRSAKWNNAIDLASSLMGSFGGELDSFYFNVIEFSSTQSKLGVTEWDGIRRMNT